MRRIRRRGRPPLDRALCSGRACSAANATSITGSYLTRSAARRHSERCCGIPASSARTSVSRYRRCPPSVRMEVSFPALAHRVTVFGSTRNMVATSAGVSRGSASGVRADMLTASPPGPVLRSCVCSVPGSPAGACRGCPIWSTQTILPSPAVTSRPPGAKCFSALRHVAPFIRVTLRDSSDPQGRNGEIRKSHPPPPSASLLDGLQLAPPGAQPLVHGGCQLKLPASEGTHGGGYLSYRLVSAERVVIEQLNQPSIIKFHQRVRVELLQPAPDLLERDAGVDQRSGGRCALSGLGLGHARWLPGQTPHRSPARCLGRSRNAPDGAERSCHPPARLGHGRRVDERPRRGRGCRATALPLPGRAEHQPAFGRSERKI